MIEGGIQGCSPSTIKKLKLLTLQSCANQAWIESFRNILIRIFFKKQIPLMFIRIEI